ncbi:aldo/keto reductase [Streptomyces sp. NPDC017529]|uniref:aldo/keto reductase n=1 Tax=Streptomyces sp. NPDC017529 TaxID=3365000 RepID=UPI0037AC14B3
MKPPTTTLPSGAAMPLLGFGTLQMRGEDAYRAVLHALRAGYRHVDTAQLYGNEEAVGQALADSGIPRGEVFVTTKFAQHTRARNTPPWPAAWTGSAWTRWTCG